MKTILIPLLTVIVNTSFSQYNKYFIDSIDQVIKSKNYNKYNMYNQKEGFWVYTKSYLRLERPDEIRVYSGFYHSGKKIGVWEEKKYGLWIRFREIYLDTIELEKTVINFLDNGSISDESTWLFDPLILDTIYNVNPEKGQPIEKVIKGKYTKNGIFRYYWDNGQLKSFGKIINNKEKGIWLYYNEKGELIESKFFD